MCGAYYNENDPYAAQWLRNLIAAGHIAPGEVDDRSIEDVRPDDLKGFTQAHFFAGIGGWSLALRLAGWPDDRPVWTGSCPCQPFSGIGEGKAADDERHLWPAWFPLIAECRPAIVFGEQVEEGIGWGWLDLVFAQMESEGYASGAAVLPAAGVGAPHRRNRIMWVGDRVRTRLERHPGHDRRAIGRARTARSVAPASLSRHAAAIEIEWRNPDWLRCTDGRWRPVRPGSFPLADGVSARVGRLRAYGNAIVPQVAAQFIAACD